MPSRFILKIDIIGVVAKARTRRTVAATGYFVVTASLVCFYSRMAFSSDIRYRLPLSKVKSAEAGGCRFFQHNGLRLALEGQADLQFDFKTARERDLAIHLINQASSSEALFTAALSTSPEASESHTPSFVASPEAMSALGSEDPSVANTHQLPSTPTRNATSILAPLARALNKANTLNDLDGVRKNSTKKIVNLPQGTIFCSRGFALRMLDYRQPWRCSALYCSWQRLATKGTSSDDCDA